MSREIKISGDVTALKKSILDLSKTINKELTKSKVELFTPATKKFLQTEAIAQANNLKNKMEAIRQTIVGHADAMKDVVAGSEKELELKQKILKASRLIVEAQKEHSQALKFSKDVDSVSGENPGGPKGILATLMEHKLLAGAGGLAVGALAYAGSRVMAGRSTYSSGVPDRLKLMGRGLGASELEAQNPDALANAGLNSLSMRSNRLRDMEIFGSQGATEKSVTSRASFERNFGLEDGTVAGIGSALRPSLGGKGAEATTMKLQASFIASGIKDAIGPYLETATALLSDINEKGFVQDEGITSMLNQLLQTGMGEGHAKKLMEGVDQSIRGSSGEANAFYQDVFNKAGIGGGTIGGARAGIQMGGLFGADLDKYKMSESDKKMYQGMGIGGSGSMQKVSSGILEHLDTMFNQKDIDRKLNSKNPNEVANGQQMRLSREQYLQAITGLQNPGQASEVEELLRKAANPATSDKERKAIQEQYKKLQDDTPELKHLDVINASIMGVHDILANKKISIEDTMGMQTSETFNSMNGFLYNIDQSVSKILSILDFSSGPKNDFQKGAQTAMMQAGAGFGGGQFTPEEAWASITGSGKLGGMTRESLTPGSTMSKEESAKPFYDRQTIDKKNPDSAKMLDYFGQLVSLNSIIAKNSKEKGTLKPGTASTTGR